MRNGWILSSKCFLEKKHAELSAEEKDKILNQIESPRQEMIKNEYKESQGKERRHIGDMTPQATNQELQSLANKNNLGDKDRDRMHELLDMIEKSTKMNDNQKEKFLARLNEIYRNHAKNLPRDPSADIDPSKLGNQK